MNISSITNFNTSLQSCDCHDIVRHVSSHCCWLNASVCCFGLALALVLAIWPLWTPFSLSLWHQGTGFWDGLECGSLSMHTWSNIRVATSGSSSCWPCQGCKNGGVLVSYELILVLLLTLARCVLTWMIKGDLDGNNGHCNLRWIDLIPRERGTSSLLLVELPIIQR